MKQLLNLSPADLMAINDGRPFNQEDAGRNAQVCLFPPPLETVYGATRVATARALGWNGHGNWETQLKSEIPYIGNWAVNGDFKIDGLFFINEKNEVLLPIPANTYALIDGNKTIIESFHLTENPLMTDLEEQYLLDFSEHPTEKPNPIPLLGRYAPATAVRALLNGEPIEASELGNPNNIFEKDDEKERLPGWQVNNLANIEYRVGLERDSDTRIAKEGLLYASKRWRLHHNVRMVTEITGPECNNQEKSKLKFNHSPAITAPFGGENRFAFFETETNAEITKEFGKIESSVSIEDSDYGYCLTPYLCEKLPQSGSEIEINGERKIIKAIITDGIKSQAGRSLEAKSKSQRTIAQFLIPAGSLIYFDQTKNNQSNNGTIESKHQHMGYGRILLGKIETE